MTRPIKFRFWDGMKMQLDIVAGRFGAFYVNPGTKGDGLDPKDVATLSPFNTRYADEAHIMQFTGLLDTNGKEIYEGDIVKLAHSSEDYPGMSGSIEWCDQCCGGYRIQFVGIGNNERFAPYAEFAEIIGNIYENADLLAV